MKIQYVNEKDFKTTDWSGGTTTEYYIFPPSGDYGKRDFNIRISSAVMRDENSTFTELPGVERFLTPLSNTLELTVNKETISLYPYEVINFMGTDEVYCTGIGTDFNLMLKAASGMMETHEFENDNITLLIDKKHSYAIYSYDGKATIEYKNDKYLLDKHNMVIISPNQKSEETINVSSLGSRYIIVCMFSVNQDD